MTTPVFKASAQPDAPACRLLVVDPQPLMVAGLSRILENDLEIRVAWQAACSTTALEILRKHPVDVMVAEVRLAEGDGLSLIEEVCRDFPSVQAVVLTAVNEWIYCERALAAGARGFIDKSIDCESLVRSLHEILAGKIVVSDEMSQLLFTRLSSSGTAGVSDLTQRELQVFELIGAGLSTREIAERLSLSPKTIDTYRDKIKQKLNLDSSARLNRTAWEWAAART